jgi:hypothetical protein
MKFSSNLKIGAYTFKANIRHLISIFEARKQSLSEVEMQVLEEEFNLFVLPTFGKTEDAKKCLNCGDHKFKLLNMSQQLYSRSSQASNWIHGLLLREILFDSQS